MLPNILCRPRRSTSASPPAAATATPRTANAEALGRCPGGCWCTPGPHGPPVYPQLCTLERLGLAARVHYPNPDCITHGIAQRRLRQHLAGADSRAVYWHYVDTAVDTAVNALLDALEDA